MVWQVDYLAVELRNGKLYFHWNNGDGKGVIESENTYNNGEWTYLQILRAELGGRMTIQRGGT